jgi:uncharacterized membrane-anchored protein
MLLRDHPLRQELNDEVHARPPDALVTPLRLTYLALLSPWSNRDREWQLVAELARLHGVTPPDEGVNHFSADLGPFRLTWERHTEFARYVFAFPSASAPGFADAPLGSVPADWVQSLPGQLLVAARAVIVRGTGEPLSYERVAAENFDGNTLVGSTITDSAAAALTDFRIHGDGYSRWYIVNHTMGSRQTGRVVQRLLEIDTYRILALMALPVARELGPFLTKREQELAQITETLAASRAADEGALLERLTRLEAEIDSREEQKHYRFGAAAAYYDLVKRRIGELREGRLEGLQTFQGFMERRLAPAMNTCRAISTRQQSLQERVARATQLLSTRIDMTREQQNQALLESMNKRAALQLRLQSTVEGLSVAAVTYYVVGLVNFLVEGLESMQVPLNAALTTVISVPVVALVVALAVRRVRRMVDRREPG